MTCPFFNGIIDKHMCKLKFRVRRLLTMKKMIALLLAALMICAMFTGCGEKGTRIARKEINVKFFEKPLDFLQCIN